MHRFCSPPRLGGLLLAAALVGPAAAGRAQETDLKEVAKTANDRLKEVREGLAKGPGMAPRLRIDKFTAGEQQLQVHGVFLNPGANAKARAAAYKAAKDALSAVFEERTGLKGVKFGFAGIDDVDTDRLPHIALQKLANEAGGAADQLRLDDARYEADGRLALVGQAGKEAGAAEWLRAKVDERVRADAQFARVVGPAGVNWDTPEGGKWALTKWALTPAALRKEFAAGPADLRRVRVDRVYLVHKPAVPDTPEAEETTHGVYYDLTLAGVTVGKIEDGKELQAVAGRLWPQLFKTTLVKYDLKPLIGEAASVTDPTTELQPVVATRRSLGEATLPPAVRADLDGTRVEPGAVFDEKGRLALSGIRPPFDGRGGEAAWKEAVVGCLREVADKRLLDAGVSTDAMRALPTRKVLVRMREWARDEMEDVKLSRLYFDESGKLALAGHYARPEDVKKIRDQLEKVFGETFPPSERIALPPAGAPGAAARPAAGRAGVATVFTAAGAQGAPIGRPAQPPAIPLELSPLKKFDGGFTEFLRKQIAADREKWHGVLVERGFFDPDEDRFTLTGLADTDRQKTDLNDLIRSHRENVKWAPYFATEPAPVKLDTDLPMKDLVERVRRVALAYPVFDGVVFHSADYDADWNLAFRVGFVGRVAEEGARAQLASLLRQSRKWARRLPGAVRTAAGPARQPPAGRDVRFIPVPPPRIPVSTEIASNTAPLAADLMTRHLFPLPCECWKPDAVARARELIDVGLSHAPDDSACWYLSACLNHLSGNKELAHRDLYRVVGIEGLTVHADDIGRRRRHEVVSGIQGGLRHDLDALLDACRREVQNGARPITLDPQTEPGPRGP